MNTTMTTLRRPVTMTLRNGARIAAIHDPRARNACVVLSVAAGMRLEEPGEEGMLHLLEHLIYQDGQHVSAAQRQSAIERHGGSMGGHTHMDYSEFFETGPVDQLPVMARRLVEQVFHPALRQEQIAGQVTAVATERSRRLAGAPGGVLPWPHLLPQCWDAHSHAHDGSGDADLAGRVDADRLRELHARHYRVSESCLVVLGPKPAEAMLPILAAQLEDRPSLPARAAGAGAPARDEPSTMRSPAAPGTAPRLLAATTAHPSARIDDALLGEHLAAAALALQPGLDASAGMFGPGDLARDDLFVLVDDTGQGIEPAARLAALQTLDHEATWEAAQRALFTAEALVHDDERYARTVARDLLLRHTDSFAAQLADTLAGCLDDDKRRTRLLHGASERLAAQPFHLLLIDPDHKDLP